MPRITLTLTPEDFALLKATAKEMQRGPAHAAERLLHRTLAKRVASGSQSKSSPERAAERSHRHLQMLEWIEEHGGWEAVQTLAGKRRLMEAFGVGQRTVYRDLDVLARLRRIRPQARESAASPESEPRRAITGVTTHVEEDGAFHQELVLKGA